MEISKTIEQLEEDLRQAEVKYFEMKDSYMKDLYFYLIKSLRVNLDTCKELKNINRGV